MTHIGQPNVPSPARRERAITHRHRWMLLLAFEILVYGFAQASLQPVRRAGIIVEKPLIPNHVIT